MRPGDHFPLTVANRTNADRVDEANVGDARESRDCRFVNSPCVPERMAIWSMGSSRIIDQPSRTGSSPPESGTRVVLREPRFHAFQQRKTSSAFSFARILRPSLMRRLRA